MTAAEMLDSLNAVYTQIRTDQKLIHLYLIPISRELNML